MKMIQKTNYYTGEKKDLPETLGYGSLYFATDEAIIYQYGVDGLPTPYLIGQLVIDEYLSKTDLSPQVVAGPVEFLQDITVPSGSVILGKDGARLSSAGRAMHYTDARTKPTLFPQYHYENTGSETPTYWEFQPLLTNFEVCPDNDGTIINVAELPFVGALGDSATVAFYLIPERLGPLRIQVWEGSDDTGAVLLDYTFEVGLAATLATVQRYQLPVPLITESGDNQFVRLSGIPLLGAVQTTGAFPGQLQPFVEFDVHLMTKKLVASQEYADNISQGDMQSVIYDPGFRAVDIFDFNNMPEGTVNKILTQQERDNIAANTLKVSYDDSDVLKDADTLSPVTSINKIITESDVIIAPVNSVNGKTGTVVLDPTDVGASEPGDNVSDFANDAGYITLGDLPGPGNHSALTLDDGTNPHGTTKADVGLSSVNNTSDLDKPVSVPTQYELDLKVDNTRVLTDVPAGAVFTDTIYDDTALDSRVTQNETDIAGKAPMIHTHASSEITDFDTEVSNNSSVVANTAKVSNVDHPLVETAVPAGAVFTDTIYDDTALDSRVTQNETDISNKADKIIPATGGNLASLDPGGNLADSGAAVGDFAPFLHSHIKSEITDFNEADYATAAQGALADTALQPGDITENVYGTERVYAVDLTLTSEDRNFNNPGTKVSITTHSLPSGTYRVTANCRYGWMKDDYASLGIYNGTSYVKTPFEYKSDENNNRFMITIISPDLALSGVNTFSLHYGGDSNMTECNISDATIELIRVA